MVEGNIEVIGNQTEEVTFQPLAIIFLEAVEQEWKQQQANLDELVKEATRNEDLLFNPIKLNEDQNSEIQPKNNIPRWIQFPNEGPLFTNGRLVSDIPETSAMGKTKNALRE